MAGAHVDVLIVGAGLSGIGAAYRLQTRCHDRTYVILEARATLGGTWDLFRYPGVRSDSDMFTYGYPFRPWAGRHAIADGASILAYIGDTAAEHGIDAHIRFRHRVIAASWSSVEARWTVAAQVEGDAQPVVYTCRFLYLCSGYYDYTSGYEVEFPGRDEFAGQIVHPQRWPTDLDYRDQRVVVIGSGATAVTLVPAMAAEAAHVTMLQRSPTYIVSRPSRDRLADGLRVIMPGPLANRLIRWRNVLLTIIGYLAFRRWPRTAAQLLRQGVRRQLPASIPVDPHFAPHYDPWDQRLCLVPDGDLFAALRAGTASVVTDRISSFTPKGIRLASGEHLDADIIVTATGITMVAFGKIALTVDGRVVEPSRVTVYKGMMYSGVPNLAWCVGYANNSWTLRADLTARHVCRLLNHMARHAYDVCVPRADPPSEPDVAPSPILDLASGYIRRAADRLPRQGGRHPWRLRQNYLTDLAAMRFGRVDDHAIALGRARRSSTVDRVR